MCKFTTSMPRDETHAVAFESVCSSCVLFAKPSAAVNASSNRMSYAPGWLRTADVRVRGQDLCAITRHPCAALAQLQSEEVDCRLQDFWLKLHEVLAQPIRHFVEYDGYAATTNTDQKELWCLYIHSAARVDPRGGEERHELDELKRL